MFIEYEHLKLQLIEYEKPILQVAKPVQYII